MNNIPKFIQGLQVYCKIENGKMGRRINVFFAGGRLSKQDEDELHNAIMAILDEFDEKIK